MPLVSVLMSVYNGEKYLRNTVDSILSQVFNDFEFIIVNDCSCDNTATILNDYAVRDNRIKVNNNQVNLGLTKSLNVGLKHCSGKYVARLDADDISFSGRLQKQYEYMEKYPEIVLCGTQGWYLSERGEKIGEKNLPTDYKQIKNKLLFNNQFIHSSLFIRRETLEKEGLYNESFKTSQDYELVLRLAAKYSVINLPERLIGWRVGRNSISWSGKRQERDAIRARWLAIWHYGYPKLLGLFNIFMRLGWLMLPQRIKIKRYF